MRNTRVTTDHKFNHTQSFGVLRYLKLSLFRHKIGELLVLRGVISPAQLKSALKSQKQNQKPLGAVFLDMGFVSSGQLQRLLLGQRVLRVVAACTLYLSFGSIKSSYAQAIKDVPARIALASAGEHVFSPLVSYPSLFGAGEKRSTDLKAFTKWTSMFKRFDAALNGSASKKIVKSLKLELSDFQSKSIHTMARQVNTMMNRQQYIVDSKNWGKSDYWATPIEFMTRGGDCEDFAIAKYVALRALGVPENRMRIAIVQDEQKNIPHAILIVYTEKGPYVLDNQIKTIRTTKSISHYRPIFSINREAWWLHTTPNTPTTIVASAAR